MRYLSLLSFGLLLALSACVSTADENQAAEEWKAEIEAEGDTLRPVCSFKKDGTGSCYYE